MVKIFKFFTIENVRNLLKLAEKDSALQGVVRGIAYDFEKLPDNVRNLIFKEKVQNVLKEIIQNPKNFDDVDLLLKFVKYENFKKFKK